MLLRFAFALAAALPAQQQPPFRATVPVVLVPVTVREGGKYVEGLGEKDFTVLDNGRPQRVQVDAADVVTARLAAVVAIQANEISAAANGKIRKAGAIIQPMVTGEWGRAAVILYGERVRVAQEFTADAGAITQAFRGIREEAGKRARMVDAISEGVEMLRRRPPGERRVLIVIGESRDRGSETKADAVLKAVQREGITVYSVVYSTYLTPFTTKASELPQSGPFDLLAIFTEPARLAKVNVAEVLARESGGRKFGFQTLKGLESDLCAVGEEVHSQYLLSYAAPAGEAGFHRIEVKVNGRDGATVRARVGYWGE